MEDRFDFIAVEAGTISSSQEEKLLRSRFILEPAPSSTASSGDSIEEEEEEEGTERFKISDHGITIRSASDSSRSTSELDPSGDGDLSVSREKSLTRVSTKKGLEEARKGKRSIAFSDESTQEPEADLPREDPAENLKISRKTRKLPAFFRAGNESAEKLVPSESEIIDLLLKFAKTPDKRLENVDFLEVLAMKGIHVPPPRWWPPGGYELR